MRRIYAFLSQINTYFVYITEFYYINYAAVAGFYGMSAGKYFLVFKQNRSVRFFHIFLAFLFGEKLRRARALYFRIARGNTAYILLARKHMRVNQRIALFNGIAGRYRRRSAHRNDIAHNSVHVGYKRLGVHRTEMLLIDLHVYYQHASALSDIAERDLRKG